MNLKQACSWLPIWKDILVKKFSWEPVVTDPKFKREEKRKKILEEIEKALDYIENVEEKTGEPISEIRINIPLDVRDKESIQTRAKESKTYNNLFQISVRRHIKEHSTKQLLELIETHQQKR